MMYVEFLIGVMGYQRYRIYHVTVEEGEKYVTMGFAIEIQD